MTKRTKLFEKSIKDVFSCFCRNLIVVSLSTKKLSGFFGFFRFWFFSGFFFVFFFFFFAKILFLEGNFLQKKSIPRCFASQTPKFSFVFSFSFLIFSLLCRREKIKKNSKKHLKKFLMLVFLGFLLCFFFKMFIFILFFCLAKF